MSTDAPERPALAVPLRAAIAEEVRALLGRRMMSQIELARRIGKSHTYVGRRLSGETAFDTDDLEAIAAVLAVAVVELLPASMRRSGDTKPYRPTPCGVRPFDRRPPGRSAGSTRPTARNGRPAVHPWRNSR